MEKEVLRGVGCNDVIRLSIFRQSGSILVIY